jgi:signal transduction histidine kinase
VNRLFDASAYVFNPNSLLPLASTLALWAMLIFLGVKSGDRRLRRAFAMFIGLISLWTGALALAMSVADHTLALALGRLTIAVLCCAGPLALHFASALLRKSLGLLFPIAVGVSVATAGLSLTSPKVVSDVWRPPWGGFYPSAGPWLPYVIAPVLLGVLAAAVWEVKHARHARALRRRQLIYVAASQVMGLLGGIDLFGVYEKQTFPVAWATALLSTALVLYTIAEHRLLGIRTVAHRSVGWAVLSLFVIPPIFLVSRGSGGLGWDHPVPTTLVLAVLFVGTRLYLLQLAPRVSKIQGGPVREALAELAAAFGERAVGARSAEEVRELAMLTIRDGTRVEHTLLAVREPGGVWRLLPESEGPPLRDAEPALAWLASQEEPVTRELLDILPDDELSRSVGALLDRFAAEAVMPLRHGGELVGLLAVGPPKRADRPRLDDEELAFLRTLGSQAGLALVNARLYEEVRRRSFGLEAEVRQRTVELARKLEELKHAQARVVHAERMSALGILVAGVSHEINNALNFIYGNLPTLGKYTQVLDELGKTYSARLPDGGAAVLGDLSQRAHAARDAVPKIADVIGEGAKQARGIVEDLRRFARKGDEKDMRPVVIHEGLSSALNLLRSRLRGRVEIVRRFTDDLPPVIGNAMQLNQAWMALLLNAAQAVQGDGRIEIETIARDGHVTVTIRDTGEGISPELHERIFEPFFTTRNPGEGSGLGLTVARDVIQRHGGRIEVESQKGQGAAFRVVLPVGRAL